MSGTPWWMKIAYAAWVASGYVVLFLFGAAVIRLLRWLDGRRKRARRDDET